MAVLKTIVLLLVGFAVGIVARERFANVAREPDETTKSLTSGVRSWRERRA